MKTSFSGLLVTCLFLVVLSLEGHFTLKIFRSTHGLYAAKYLLILARGRAEPDSVCYRERGRGKDSERKMAMQNRNAVLVLSGRERGARILGSQRLLQQLVEDRTRWMKLQSQVFLRSHISARCLSVLC